MPPLDQIISSWYEQEFRWQGPSVSIRRHYEDLFARIFRNHQLYYVFVEDEGSEERTRCVLKVHDTAEAARNEFDLLEKINAHFQKIDKRFAVPMPLALFPAERAFLMSLVPGKRLDKIMWPYPVGLTRFIYNPRTSAAAIEKAALWLAFFQKGKFRPDCPHNLRGESVRKTLLTVLSRSRRLGLPLKIADAIQEWIGGNEDNISRMTSTCVPLCLFDPEHIFASTDTTSVVDFEEPECGWPGEDPVSFLGYCDLKWSPLLPKMTTDHVGSVFFRAYAREAQIDRVFRASVECFYIRDLLNTYLSQTKVVEGWSWCRKLYTAWKAGFARAQLARRTAKGTWQTILEWD